MYTIRGGTVKFLFKISELMIINSETCYTIKNKIFKF